MAYDRKTYDILISDELKNILEEIKNESEVASLILQKRHYKDELVDDPVNFLSISRDDRTKISYLTVDRMASIDPSDYWTSSRRFQAKPGGFINKLFKSISSKEVEKFSNLFRSQVNKPDFVFSVVKGSRIKDYYHYESYASQEKGSLGASCMKHQSCQKYLDLYVENDDVISMLIMKDFYGQLIGRALLWNFDSYKIMDRIYTKCDEELLFYFKQWATNNGYLYKSEQNWFNTLQFEQIGSKRQEIKLEVKLKETSFSYFPYMDTFKFFDVRTRTLTNYQTDSQHLRTLCSSEGTIYDGDYLRFDAIDHVYRYRQDAVYVNYKKFWTHQKNTEYSEVNDCYILCTDLTYDESIGDFVFSGEFASFNNEDAIKEKRKSYQSTRNISEILKISKKLGLSIEQLENLGLELPTEQE